MDILQSVADRLTEAGISVTVNPVKESFLAQFNMFSNTRPLGNLLLQGRLIDEISLTALTQQRQQSGPGGSYKVRTITGVNVDYILKGDIKGKENILRAKLNVKRKGLLHPRVTEMKWEGGEIAGKLNADNEINESLWQSFGKVLARDIEIQPDEKDGSVNIHVRDDIGLFKGVVFQFEMYEKIAKYIYDAAGITRAEQPAPLKTTVKQEPVAESETAAVKAGEAADGEQPDVKYCFKCGVSMPQDAAFCPNCGTKQD